MRRAVLPMSLVAAVVSVAACASDEAPGGTSAALPASGCAVDGRKDTYAEGLAKRAGPYRVTIIEAKPGPPTKGTNAMTLEILDAADRPVDGATVTVTPFMPDHGHGSAVKPTVTPSGTGRYHVEKIYLAMAGLWRITVSVQPPGGQIHEVAFQFCLDG